MDRKSEQPPKLRALPRGAMRSPLNVRQGSSGTSAKEAWKPVHEHEVDENKLEPRVEGLGRVRA